MKITVFYENHSSHAEGKNKRYYPAGIGEELKFIAAQIDGAEVTLIKQQDPENGITDALLKKTDVLLWYGDQIQDRLLEESAKRVKARIFEGMGGVFLAKSYLSKPFLALTGIEPDPCEQVNVGNAEIWTIAPTHPIAAGLPSHWKLSAETSLADVTSLPRPDDTVFLSWFEDGKAMRSGITYLRGKGKLFWFQACNPGTPTLKDPNVQQVIKNAILWALPPAASTSAAMRTEPKKRGLFRLK